MKIAPLLYELSEQVDIKMLPLHQTSYQEKTDLDVYEALIKIDNESNEMPKDADYSFLNKEELETMFSDYPFVFASLAKVIDSISFKWKKPNFQMPIFPIPKGSSSEYLKSLSIIGLKKRLKKTNNPDHKIYQKRLLYELSVIDSMGFNDYFLIVYDFVKYAKTHDILVGPGRGSSAGSLVAYCIGITDVDPITYGLLFERFLNPERLSMPDIDMDFPDDKRDEILQYVKQKYGTNHIISITTFGRFALRSSIRDIARVMKIDISRVKGIIQSVINDNIDQSDFETMRLLEVAKKIEGLPRYSGTHAAGIIMAQQDLTKHLPLQQGAQGFYQSQLDQVDLESLGLLKVDFLGIRNLAIIDQTIKAINKQGENFSLPDLSLDDSKTYKTLANAETTGIFQVESRGMRATLRKLKPNCFEDIVAILALYRPGPMDNIDLYIARRNGKEFSYVHPDLKEILKPTYGIIVYQEQIMRIAHEFAGYSLAEADLLRRGISKKDKNILEKERKKFLASCTAKNYSTSVSQEIYDYIVKFADYGFNRSHSVAYALITYQMAYLKANFFPTFMTILLSNNIGNEGTIKQLLDEAKKQQIKIMTPNINISTNTYICLDKAIYPPLIEIKTIGRVIADKLIEERQNGEFRNFQEFKSRVKNNLNEQNITMLIHSGALDIFGLNHKTLIYHMDIEQSGFEQYIPDFKIALKNDYTFGEKAEFEKEALGYNVLYNPIRAFENLIKKHNLDSLHDLDEKAQIKVLAYVTRIKVIKTKKGQEMAFLELDDGLTQIDTTLFSKGYEEYKQTLDNEVYIFSLKNNVYREKKSVIIEKMKKIENENK